MSVIDRLQPAHVSEPEFLNSQKIESRYGSYHIEMLSDDGQTRQSALSSDGEEGRICRTFAVTRFRDDIDSLNIASQAQIRDGASIGAALQQEGWNILKATVHVGKLRIDDAGHPVIRKMRLEVPQALALHIYILVIEKDGQTYDYATISEIHHPDYLREEDVRKLFPVDASLSAQAPQLDELLSIIRDAA